MVALHWAQVFFGKLVFRVVRTLGITHTGTLGFGRVAETGGVGVCNYRTLTSTSA